MAHEILIVDDEPDIRLLIDGILRDEGYETRMAADSDSAIAAFRHRRPSMVILDVWLQNSRLDGLGILQALHVEEPQIPVVMISGHGTIEMAVTAIQHGAYDFLEKPFQSDRLLLQARRALEAAKLARENAELRLRAGAETSLTGESSAITTLRAGVERVAPTGSRVLIHGPAGSGKEVAARMVHARSRRSEGPFVALNCATLAPGRFEEELFGVEAGHDAAAAPRRAGVLERAHGGTLLLDEVSDMPLETQGKIVRALQDQTFERLGGNAPRKGGRARARHHQQGPPGGDRSRAVPRGPVLPIGRGAAEDAEPEGAAGGHPGPRAPLHHPLGRELRYAAARALGGTRWPRCRPMTGPATCARLAGPLSWTRAPGCDWLASLRLTMQHRYCGAADTECVPLYLNLQSAFLPLSCPWAEQRRITHAAAPCCAGDDGAAPHLRRLRVHAERVLRVRARVALLRALCAAVRRPGAAAGRGHP